MITHVEPCDAAAIADIFNHYVENTTISFETTPIDAETMKKRIMNISALYPYLIYKDDDKILGYAYAHAWKERAAYFPTAEITIYLHKDAIGRGIGSILMNSLIMECRKRRLHSLIACITADNTESIRFHQKFGFKQVSIFRQVGYKFHRWLDVTDLQLIL